MKLLILPLLLSLLPPSTASPSHCPTTVTKTCSRLSKYFPTQLHFPNTAAYNATNTAFYDASSILFPACIFHPHSALNVAKALKILRRHKTPFAVKGGGHMPGGASNIGPEGVLISMEKLDSVEWGDTDEVLKVGAGNRWGPVYKKASEKGRVVVGGRRADVGVVGLVIGGGISFLSGEYGWACDNVAGFEVVLLNGTIVYATQTAHKDLYRALRGGTANFGLVTRLDLVTHNIPLGWSSLSFHDFTTVPSLRDSYITALIDYLLHGASSHPKSGAVNVLLWSPSLGITAGYSNLWYSTPSAPISNTPNTTVTVPSVFTAITAIPGLHQTSNLPLSTFISSLDSLTPPAPSTPQQNVFRTSTFLADESLIREFIRVFDSEYAALADIPGLTTGLTFQPITPHQMLASTLSGRGENVLNLESYARENKTLVVTEQTISWALPGDRERVQETQRRVQRGMEKWAEERGLKVGWWYLNDADGEQRKEVWGGLGEGNGRFLRGVREKYGGGLERLWKGGFKL
ncbi:FAD-binding domain-containing protein [Ascodesmis nigricans]|uniref:FAD-binding domain-containing protein n=1 Tax=Ascodesmis nigricans TaxID=341454 RepID=A0A4S2MR71_9PEZI|nr:FAD-binding domain-containing protein [Ascodesmis nigricans]